MNLNKEAKIKLLENFYGLDYIFFGKPVKEVEVCCPVLVTEYLAVKGALLSTLIEMYRLVNYSPKEISSKISSKELRETSSKTAIWSKERAKDLLSKNAGKKCVKEHVAKIVENDPAKRKNIEKIVEAKIKEKALSLAIDNMLVARMLVESKQNEKLNNWKGRVLEDAYKILRDNLIECAISFTENGK